MERGAGVPADRRSGPPAGPPLGEPRRNHSNEEALRLRVFVPAWGESSMLRASLFRRVGTGSPRGRARRWYLESSDEELDSNGTSPPSCWRRPNRSSSFREENPVLPAGPV